MLSFCDFFAETERNFFLKNRVGVENASMFDILAFSLERLIRRSLSKIT